MTSDELQALRRAVASVSAPEVLDDAVDAQRVFAAVSGELPRAEAQALLARAVSEPSVGFYVRTALATLREDEDDAVLTEPPANRGSWVAVAVAVAAVALATLFTGVPRPAPDTLRAVEMGAELSVVTVRLHPERPVLRWVPMPEAQAYRVSVQAEDMKQLVNARVTHPELRLDLSELPASGRIFVRVTAEQPSGVPVSGPPRAVQLP